VIVVERHHIKATKELLRLASMSKELYNRCNFLMRKAWFEKERLPDISILIKETQHLDCFKNLHNTKTAKQTIRQVLTDWSNYRKALSAYKKDKSKFLGCPKPPHYKKKLAQVIFYNETIKGGQSGKPLDFLTPTNGCFSIKSDKPFKQVVATPKTFGFMVEVQYEQKALPKARANKNNFCCIDIGLNNLATITSDKHSPILINGRIVKSFNRWYNKNISKKTSRKRYFRLENYFHHVSKMIIENCAKHNIGTIVIGKNDGWKTGIKLGKKTNQNFQSVPFCNLLQKIQYKANALGIDVIFTEESYTSQASFLDRDEIPVWEKGQKNEQSFSGTRIERGLYRSAEGALLNADANGSANIGRKVFPNTAFSCEWDRSVAATPVVVNPLRQAYVA
jgi:IS605 OrfB family transposase